MVQGINGFLQLIAKCDEVKYISVFIQRSGQLGRDTPVVSVQPLTDIAIKGDKVCCTENQMIFGDSHLVPGKFIHVETLNSGTDEIVEESFLLLYRGQGQE